MKVINISFLVISCLVFLSCDKHYKMITYKGSTEFGVMQSESEIKAKNDSIAYCNALLDFYIGKELEKTVYKDRHENSYRSIKFKLYNSDDEYILPPNYSNTDMMRLQAILKTDSTELCLQILRNLYKNSWEN